MDVVTTSLAVTVFGDFGLGAKANTKNHDGENNTIKAIL